MQHASFILQLSSIYYQIAMLLEQFDNTKSIEHKAQIGIRFFSMLDALKALQAQAPICLYIGDYPMLDAMSIPLFKMEERINHLLCSAA